MDLSSAMSRRQDIYTDVAIDDLMSEASFKGPGNAVKKVLFEARLIGTNVTGVQG